jgi:hypothetical protein
MSSGLEPVCMSGCIGSIEEAVMFENTKAFSGLAVDDVPKARRLHDPELPGG